MAPRIMLKELVEIFLGLTHTPEYVQEGVPFLSVKDISNGKIDFSKCNYITEEEYNSLPRGAKPQPGDMLFCRVGTIGKPVIIESGTPKFGSFVSLGFFRLKDTTLCKLEYLYYWMFSDSFYSQVKENVKGASQINLNTGWLSKFKVPMCSIEEQEKIIRKLGQIDGLIELRRKQLNKLDELVKSRFIELFGDPRINPQGYEILPISALFDVGSSKRVFESEWRESGVPFYRAREIVKLSKDGFVDNELFIDEDMYESYKERYGVPRAGDMMVTGVGTLGVCYIVKETDKFYFKDGNTLWFKNKGLCDVRFIKDQYETDFVRDQIVANANVSTVGTYTITNANNTMVLVPPINEQTKYVEFCKQVDKSKLAIQKSLEKLEILKKSLMQQYFG